MKINLFNILLTIILIAFIGANIYVFSMKNSTNTVPTDEIVITYKDLKFNNSNIDNEEFKNKNMYIIKSFSNSMKAKIENGKLYISSTSDSIGTASYTKANDTYYLVENSPSNVVDVVMTQIPTSGYPIFVLLMEDGTIGKTKFVQGDNIVYEGAIANYTDIVKLNDAEYLEENTFGDDTVKVKQHVIIATEKDSTIFVLKDLY